jgi:RNA polymerase-binding transcription factor DksA
MTKKLTKEQLAYFENRLLQMKKENVASIESNVGSGPNDAAQELTDFANHPADMGTEQFEQEKEAGFTRIHKENLEAINDALERIKNGTYGISEKSGKVIPKERLEAIPTARYLVDEKD